MLAVSPTMSTNKVISFILVKYVAGLYVHNDEFHSLLKIIKTGSCIETSPYFTLLHKATLCLSLTLQMVQESICGEDGVFVIAS